MAERNNIDAIDDLVFDPFGTLDAKDEQPLVDKQTENNLSSKLGGDDITKLRTEDDRPVILVHTVQRESGTVTPKNLVKRGLHSVKDFAVWIVGAIIISLVATFVINSVGANALALL